MKVLFQVLNDANSSVVGPMHGPFEPFFGEQPKPRDQQYQQVLEEQATFLASADDASIEAYEIVDIDNAALRVTHRACHGVVRQYTLTGNESEVGFIALFYAYWMAIRLGKLPSNYQHQWFEDYGHGGNTPSEVAFMEADGEFNINRVAKYAFLYAMGVTPNSTYLSQPVFRLVSALLGEPRSAHIRTHPA